MNNNLNGNSCCLTGIDCMFLSTLNKYHTNATSLAALSFALLFFLYDISIDMAEGQTTLHVAVETIVAVFILWCLYHEAQKVRDLSQQVLSQEKQLEELKGNLASKVKTQLLNWNLTPSETEVAWLIIKGFSFNEIAQLRTVKEKTNRHQAS